MSFPGKCPFPGNVAKGRVTPVLTEYFYRDYVDVTCDRGYKLMMVWCFHSFTVHLQTPQNRHCLIFFSVFILWIRYMFVQYIAFNQFTLFFRMVKRSRHSQPCVKATDSGTSLSQNARVCLFWAQIILWQIKKKYYNNNSIHFLAKYQYVLVLVLLQGLIVENPNLYWMEAWPSFLAFRISTVLLFSITVMNHFTLSLRA